jgi:hypothetical protein
MFSSFFKNGQTPAYEIIITYHDSIATGPTGKYEEFVGMSNQAPYHHTAI